jgi:hypothetical protein
MILKRQWRFTLAVVNRLVAQLKVELNLIPVEKQHHDLILEEATCALQGVREFFETRPALTRLVLHLVSKRRLTLVSSRCCACVFFLFVLHCYHTLEIHWQRVPNDILPILVRT